MAARKLTQPLLAGIVLAAVATGASVLGQSTAMARSTTPGAPTTIQPPAGWAKVATYRVKVGYQIYRCSAGAWSLKAPAAMITGDDRRGIYHYGGPTWQSMVDGSLVTAAKVADSPVRGAIPELLLEVTGHGGTADRELSTISYIQRLNTKGGLAPTGSCVDGAEQPVQYSADYVFYAPAEE